MRLLTLDLERYGPFTGRVLAFRPGAALHIVAGRNEAGKSSALAAITDLLFGFEERTRYDFVHKAPDLRLGAEIVSRDGKRLNFRRRKGRKSTLSSGEAVLPDDALTPFLGGLTRDVFTRAFGIDAKALREGGDEMLKSDGELGAAIFAAASGLRGYADLAKLLEAEASAIYTPRARDRPLNKALAAHDDLGKAMRAQKLGPDAWRDLNEGIAAATGKLETITARRGIIAAELAKSRRLKRVAPLVADLDAVLGALAADADLPDCADHEADALGAALAAHDLALTKQAEAVAIHEGLTRDLEAAPADERFTPHAEAISSAFKGVGAYEKAAADLPRVGAEAEGFERDLAALAVRAGVEHAAVLEARQPSDATKTRMDRLIAEGRDTQGELARQTKARAEIATEIETLARQGSDMVPARDPAPLRARFDAFASALRDAARAADLEKDIAREAGALDGAVARLNPTVAGIDALAAAPLPPRETVSRFDADVEAIARERQRLADSKAHGTTRVRDIGERLRERASGRPIPAKDDLAAARARRAAAWRLVRAAAFGEADAPRGAALFDAAATHERFQAEADAIADALSADAARAAEQAADRHQLEAAKADLAESEAALTVLDDRHHAIETAWTALWRPARIVPLPPADMVAWMAGLPSLLERHAALKEKRIERADLASRAAASHAPLTALARDTGLADLQHAGPSSLAQAISDRLRRLAETWDATRDRAARLKSLRDSLAAANQRLETAQQVLGAWAPRWDAILVGFGLPPGAGIPEAEAALAVWREVPGVMAGRDNRAGRVKGLQRDLGSFEATAHPLLAALAPDLAPLRVSEAVKILHERMQEARTGAAKRAEIARRHAAAERNRAAAEEAVAAAARGIQDKAVAANATPADDPVRFYQRLTRRRELLRAVAAKRAELATAGDHVPEAALRAGLGAASIDEIEALGVALTAETDHLDREGQETYHQRQDLARQRAALETSVGSEVTAARRRAVEAEIRDAARRHVVLKIASLMLGGAMAAHRGGRQDPLLERAGGLFADLTGGVFAGLAQEFDEADVPHIAGRRAIGGRALKLGDLSEGTRDQLHLALRLAYLEDYGTNAEPAPFIGDDIFATFDDARTAYGVRALAAIAGVVQPILFTHHDHVVTIARRELGEAADVIPLG